jgi:hypothetical protein
MPEGWQEDADEKPNAAEIEAPLFSLSFESYFFALPPAMTTMTFPDDPPQLVGMYCVWTEQDIQQC